MTGTRKHGALVLDPALADHAETIVRGFDLTIRNEERRRAAEENLKALPVLDVDVGAAGDLQVVRLLGSGGMAHVKLAHQRALQRDVALKMISPQVSSDHMVDALVREGLVTGRLEHPNIVPVHMLGVDREGQPVIVMKRVEGVPWSDLDDRDRAHQRGVWSDDPILRHLEVFLQVCSAASYAHAQGFAHRDIKPQNVMVGPFGEVYLLDWGVATRIGSPSFEDVSEDDPIPMPTGTAGYMAPEMVLIDGIVDERTDVYLLGASLHRILTQERKHDGSNLLEVLKSVLSSEPYDYGPEFPEELAAILNRATAPDPDERYQTAASLREAVVDFINHKSSLDLASEADRLRQRFDEAARRGDDAETRSLFAECRFAYRHALRQWSENEGAKQGLRRCLERMVGFEIDNDRLDAAEAHLSELDAPSEALVARVEAARAAQQAERERLDGLRELAYQLDSGVARAPRTLLTIIFVLLALLMLGHGLSRFKIHDLYVRALLTMPPFVLVFAVFTYLRRKVLFANLASRRLVLLLGIIIGALTIHRVLAFFARPNFAYMQSGDLIIMATGAAATSLIATPRVLYATAVWIVGAVALIVYPGNPLYIFGPCSALGAALLALAWWKHPKTT